jgi:drug/metabolite transporter (DMT)-like permease
VTRATEVSKTRWLGLAAVLVGASVLGWSAIFVRWAEAGGATALTVGLYRMLIALPGALLLGWRAGRPEGGLGGGTGRRWALLAGVAFFLDLVLWHWSMELTTAANATLLTTGLSPIWVALASVALLGARYRAIAWVGQAAGLGGALLLGLARGARGGTGRGEAIAVVASVCYAAFTLTFTRSRRSLPAPQALLWMSASCCGCFAVAALAAGHPLVGYGATAWLSLVGLGCLVQLVGWWLNSWGLGHVDVASGALALQAQQIATLFLAAWLLGEPLKPLGLVGGALIMAGIVAMAVSAMPARYGLRA